MSSLDDAKDFVAKHEKDLDEATGKAGGPPEEREHVGQAPPPEDTPAPEARDM